MSRQRAAGSGFPPSPGLTVSLSSFFILHPSGFILCPHPSGQKQTAGSGQPGTGHLGRPGGLPREDAHRPPPTNHPPSPGLWYIAPGTIRPRGGRKGWCRNEERPGAARLKVRISMVSSELGPSRSSDADRGRRGRNNSGLSRLCGPPKSRRIRRSCQKQAAGSRQPGTGHWGGLGHPSDPPRENANCPPGHPSLDVRIVVYCTRHDPPASAGGRDGAGMRNGQVLPG
jgi:hypothetical protein